jgi:predicted Ser/Thr protein kinase
MISVKNEKPRRFLDFYKVVNKNLLGKGFYSYVYLGERDGKFYAIK